MKKFTINPEKSTLFQISDKIESAEDFNRHKLDTHGENIIIDIDIAHIHVEQQVRQSFQSDSIQSLAQSISKNGLLYPILVMKHPSLSQHFILLVGESRFRAFKYLKKTTIPARVKPFIKTAGERKLVQLTENLQRNNLNPFEIADSFSAIKSELQLTQDALAKRVHRSLDTIKLYSRLSQFTEEERCFHIKNKTGIKQLKDLLKSKSVTVPLPKKTEMLPLFKETKNSLTLKSLTLHYKKETKQSLYNKISECETFVKLAKQKLQAIDIS